MRCGQIKAVSTGTGHDIEWDSPFSPVQKVDIMEEEKENGL